MMTATAERQTTLTVNSASEIVLRSPKGVTTLRWQDGLLVNPSSRIRLTAEKTAEVEAAIAVARPETYERLTGAQVAASIAAGESVESDWMLDGVAGDAVGYYSRVATPAIRPVVWIGAQDLAR